MIRPELKERIRKLNKAGYGIRWLARHLKISRQSVRKALRDKEPEEAEAATKSQETAEEEQERKPSILDPHKAEIQAMLEAHERLKKKIPGTKELSAARILKEIRKHGYAGGRTILQEYLASLRGPRRRARKPYCRFETAVAEEAQQDWSEYRVEIDSKVQVIQVFSLILCWSRFQFLKAFTDQRRETLLYAHVEAFKYFSGCPWKIVYDRQSTITPFDVGGVPLIHEGFQAFADHYGFEIGLCLPGDKERKGKIERVFLTFETDFLPARTFKSLEDLNAQLRRWLEGLDHPDDGNMRNHHTTGEVPYQRWLEEREYLYALPEIDHLPRRVEKRQVNHDCTVSVLGNLYTVPARLVEKGPREVWVSIGVADLLVYDTRGELVAQHTLSEEKGQLVINENHYKEIKRRREKRPLPELERQFLERFPSGDAFLDKLKHTLRSIAPIHLREILALSRRYSIEEVEAALEKAVSHGTTTAGYVRQILERKHPTGHLGKLYRRSPRGLSLGNVEPGDSAGYGDIFTNPKEDTDDHDHHA